MLVSIFKYRKGEVNYLNSDATWHALLTITCYEETPFNIHKFLPIVTLGDKDDKNITWGACVPDKFGNYYYTSFSPTTYALPFFFFKVFHLPTSESSLYIFNSFLYILSSALWFAFLRKLFSKSKNAEFISLLGTFIYAFSPELFHGMGIVFWAQSIFQVTFILQLFCYLCSDKKSKVWFYVFCVLNPYIEWSGFVANMGFAIVEFMKLRKIDRKAAIHNFLIIGALTFASMLLFVGHYLLNVEPKLFLRTVASRFFARNITTSVSLISLAAGYIRSFKWHWLTLLIIGGIAIAKYGNNCKRMILENKITLFLTFFPILENLLMKQHAVSYTYDRMKVAFFISLLACILLCTIFSQSSDNKRTLKVPLLSFIVVFSLMNLASYVNDTRYIWKTDYREKNKAFALSINEKYPDSVLGIKDHAVRGYANLLFHRGIYEWKNENELIEIAKAKGKRFVVMLTVNNGAWNMYDFVGAEIIDLHSNDK